MSLSTSKHRERLSWHVELHTAIAWSGLVGFSVAEVRKAQHVRGPGRSEETVGAALRATVEYNAPMDAAGFYVSVGTDRVLGQGVAQHTERHPRLLYFAVDAIPLQHALQCLVVDEIGWL